MIFISIYRILPPNFVKHVQRTMNNTDSPRHDNFTRQLLHSCVSLLALGETYLSLFFSFWLINFAAHDDAWLASSSWIISRTLLHRRSSRRTVTIATRRLSAVKNIIGDLSIAGEGAFLITFCPSPTSRKLNISPTRPLRTISLRWNYTRLRLYTARKPILVARRIFTYSCRAHASHFQALRYS